MNTMTQTTTLNNSEIKAILGTQRFKTMLECCSVVSGNEIFNEYGNVQILNYTNSSSTGKRNGNMLTVYTGMHITFISETGKFKTVYIETINTFSNLSFINCQINQFCDESLCE